MWSRIRLVMVALAAITLGATLAACNNEDGFFGEGNGPAGTSSAASITLLASSPQLGSSPNASVTVTAIVRDGNNNLLAEVPVAFSASSGALELPPASGGGSLPLTNGSGQVVALLDAGGDYTNRTITVSASSGGISQSITINVTGTSLSISGEGNATIGDNTTLTITLTDSASTPVANRVVTIASALGNPLSSTTLTTNSSGQVQVTVTANNNGNDSITASAQGASASHALVISGDQFQILAPAAAATIEIAQCVAVQVNWEQAGVAQAGQTINFSTTRGNLYSDAGCTTPATSAITNGAGTATLYVSSTNTGPGLLTAFVTSGPSTSRSVNFIATVPHSINLQASPATIGPNNSSQSVPQESIITATVRDANNNLVTGKVVRFSIIEDNSGGSLTNATATTNLLGRASTTYVSSSATTAKDGVRIRAEVDGTAINTTVALTVAQNALFVRLGTGNLINSPTSTTYGMPYTVIVTDASGNAASGVQVALSVNPSAPSVHAAYAKGQYEYDGDNWAQIIDDMCDNEDLNMNGILDAGEDANGNNQLTPGNVASVPNGVTTAADGTFEFNILYPRQFANWVHVRLTASTTVDGTESLDIQDFWLPVASGDVSGDESAPPPGVISPFGVGVCP